VKRWIVLLLILSAALSCEKSQTERFYGDISGTVTDEQTGDPLVGATVYIVSQQDATQTTTDAAGGFTITHLETGSRTLHADMTGYSSDEIAVDVAPSITAAAAFTLTAGATYGDISGKVVDAQNGANIAGATVYIVGDQASTQTTTDASGNYSITHVLSGSRMVHAEKTGYNSNEVTVTVAESTPATANLTLLSIVFASGKYTIVTTWGATPTDLDSHLWVPNGTPYHLYYSSRGDSDGTLDTMPFAGLDKDDVNGYGPETVTIQKTGSAAYYAGNYRFYIYNFTQANNMAGCGATVRVYDDGSLIKTYNVPASGTGDYWWVFDLNGSTFTDHNVLQAADPGAPP
jgi:uncharacterized protein YfaP (DUF2135 family)